MENLQFGDIVQAFKRVKKSRGCPGIDNIKIKNFELDFERQSFLLFNELTNKSYKPLPGIKKRITKSTGGYRDLVIPTVRDRIVQHILLKKLNPVFDPLFHPNSFGYRMGRNTYMAIEKINSLKHRWVIVLDMSKYFDTINHFILLRKMRKIQKYILEYVYVFLKNPIRVNNNLIFPKLGSPQGGVISPLLANIYLNKFDFFVNELGAEIIRYADDILVFAQTKQKAFEYLKRTQEYLKHLHLSINIRKTFIVNREKGIDFLGFEVKDEGLYISKKKT